MAIALHLRWLSEDSSSEVGHFLLSIPYGTHLHLPILHIRNNGVRLFVDPCGPSTLILTLVPLHEVCVQVSSRVVIAVRRSCSWLPRSRRLFCVLLIGEQQFRIAIASLSVQLTSALVSISNILLCISRKLKSLTA